MVNVKMKCSPPLNRQTLLSVNHIKEQGVKSAHNIGSINRCSSGEPAALADNNRYGASQIPASPPEVPSTVSHVQRSPMSIPQLLHTVQKGQKLPLEDSGKLSAIKACLGWNTTDPNCDVDVSAFLLNANGKVIDDEWFVFYGQTQSPDNSAIFSLEDGEDRESILVDFRKLNPAVKKIVFVLTINEAFEKKLNFSMLKEAYIRIMDTVASRELVSFKMEEYYSNVTSMMIGEIYLHNGVWRFNAIGNGVARDLAGLCELYGVQVV